MNAKGNSLEECWLKFSGEYINEETPVEVRELFQVIFYSGAQAAIALPPASVQEEIDQFYMQQFLEIAKKVKELR